MYQYPLTFVNDDDHYRLCPFYWNLESPREFQVGHCENGRFKPRTKSKKDSWRISKDPGHLVCSKRRKDIAQVANLRNRIPYEFAAILCRRTSWYIRKELTAIFGPRFSNEALDPSHAEYGCLLLNPKNASMTRGTNSRRGSGYTTMRQVRQQQQHHPYLNNKVAATATHHSRSLNLGSGADGVSSMSLSRLLNTDMSSYPLLDESSSSSPISDYDEDDTASRNGAGGLFTESPHTTPSPTFRGAASFPWPPSSSQKESFSSTSFTPMTSSYSANAKDYVSVYSSSTGSCPVPRITPVQWSDLKAPLLSSPPCSSDGARPSLAALNQDIIDTISATILLQRLSQDDGKRPFRPMPGHTIPSRVVVGDQEYRIHWDN